MTATLPTGVLTGTLRALLLFDIAEEIDLPKLREVIGTVARKREPAFRHPAPEYVRFERPPVAEHPGLLETNRGESLQTRIRYFDYGVASVELQMPFQASWSELVRLANRWISSPELEGRASALLRECLVRIESALKKPYDVWIAEDYYVIQLDPLCSEAGDILSAEELMRGNGAAIAQIVRGEELALSPTERQEVLQSSMSYYPADLLVAGWVAAFVYDSREAAIPTICRNAWSK